jgi:CRISPR-associated protein Csd1
MLDKLCELAERLERGEHAIIAPPHYDWMPIRWLIHLDSEGGFLGFVRTPDEEGRKSRGKPYLAPHVLRASGVEANLLADRADYALGFIEPDADDPKKERTAQAHEAFGNLTKDCAQHTGEPTVYAVERFLTALDLNALAVPEDLKSGDTVTFVVDGVMPIELDAVRHFWAEVCEPKGEPAQCLVCDQSRPAVERHAIKIKGIPGGQPAGMALVSANEESFESYGLEASLISPVCDECAQRYAKALNALRQKEDSHIVIGPLVYYFWTKDEIGFSAWRLLSNPEPGEVKNLVESVYSGRERDTRLDATPFYATALSASGGRVVVREWIESTVADVQHNLARYFRLQRLVQWDGSESRPIGLFALAASAVQDARRYMPPNIPRALLRTALQGSPLPDWLLYQAIKRARAEQGLTHPRAALMKMVLLSHQPQTDQEEKMEQLDEQNKNQAYVCGRLLAVLESVQRQALPGIQATILDRFYGTASSAPASVFGTLLRGTQAHLGKLRKTNEPAFHALQRRLEEVLSALPGFPAALTLPEQGLFALGYYHQRASDRAAAIAHKQASQQQGSSEPAESEPNKKPRRRIKR